MPDLLIQRTRLGLPFEEEAEAPEWQRLYERRESYRIGVVPEQGLFLTAGVDVQKDRIEVEIVAWGRAGPVTLSGDPWEPRCSENEVDLTRALCKIARAVRRLSRVSPTAPRPDPPATYARAPYGNECLLD